MRQLTCGQILNAMVILGFMFNYMLRVNITLALVDMVNTAETNSTNKYDWNKYQVGQILGSFYWGYVLSEVPGGRLAETVGAAKVFGIGMLFASLITFLTPIACKGGFLLVVLLRFMVGLSLGLTFPAVPVLASKWIPPLERSKFMANMMASSLGAAVTMPLCGFLIYHLGWESVFYATGTIGIIWYCLWFVLIFDSPAQHRRITPQEKNELEIKISRNCNGQKPDRVPWRAILTSKPVWAIIVTHTCSIFGFLTIVNQLPIYLDEVLRFDIKSNGYFSSLPHIGKYLMAVAASYTADSLRKSRRFSTTQIRKSFTVVGVFFPSIFMMIQALFGYNPILSITVFTFILFFSGSVTGGYLPNALDIAPNFAGTIFGMANTLSSTTGWISAYLVASVTHEKHTFEQWKIIFWTIAGVYCLGALAFTFLGSGDLQTWNFDHSRKEESSEELNCLKNETP